MTFLYFAYGSNLWPPQLRSRCASARELGSAVLGGWTAVYSKPSIDGSAKLSIEARKDATMFGALYEIDDEERSSLDDAEPRYDPLLVRVTDIEGKEAEALTYRWPGAPVTVRPHDWYVSTVVTGARHHGFPDRYVNSQLAVRSDPDPVARGIRPVEVGDIVAMQRVLAAALADDGDRYSPHPGELGWWMFHGDPRYRDHLSFWLQDYRGVLVIDSRAKEIGAFTIPGQPLEPLIEWAQRRLFGNGEIAWVSDEDERLVTYLRSNRYQPLEADRSYQWNLKEVDVPLPRLQEGWVLRHVEGEDEANSRREASHAAFQSTMRPSAHLDRYLGFMRSPVYTAERDLVAVAPDGRIAAFMVWWPDDSGVAQIEPFGTHPDLQRNGIGTALIHFGLRRMRDAGMRIVRVITNDHRVDANAFYTEVGFEDVGRVRRWGPSSESG